jgi:hypothetical protein
MIEVLCPCGEHIKARDDCAGQTVTCPACRSEITFPDTPPGVDADSFEVPIDLSARTYPPRRRPAPHRPNRADQEPWYYGAWRTPWASCSGWRCSKS